MVKRAGEVVDLTLREVVEQEACEMLLVGLHRLGHRRAVRGERRAAIAGMRRARDESVEGAVRHTKTGFWPARRFASLVELDELCADWRDRIALPRRHATGRLVVAERLAVAREPLRSLPPIAFDAAGRRASRVPLDGYLKHAASFYRAPEVLVHQRVELRFDRDWVWIEHRGRSVARYPRSYVAGTWQPAPRMRPEPRAVAAIGPVAVPQVVPPALTDYVELCA